MTPGRGRMMLFFRWDQSQFAQIFPHCTSRFDRNLAVVLFAVFFKRVEFRNRESIADRHRLFRLFTFRAATLFRLFHTETIPAAHANRKHKKQFRIFLFYLLTISTGATIISSELSLFSSLPLRAVEPHEPRPRPEAG